MGNNEYSDMMAYREWILNHRNDNGQRGKRTVTHFYDVRLTAQKKARRMWLSVAHEKNAKFSEKEFWEPIWVPELGKLFLVYGDKDHGFKVQKKGVKSSFGNITWTDPALYDYVTDNELSGGYDFHVDPVSRWYYIDLTKKTEVTK